MVSITSCISGFRMGEYAKIINPTKIWPYSVLKVRRFAFLRHSQSGPLRNPERDGKTIR